MENNLNSSFIVVTLIVTFVMVMINFFLLLFAGKGKKGHADKPIIDVNPEQKEKDMKLVMEAIDRSIGKSLYFFLMKDFSFSPKCKVQMYTAGHYRNLITYLLRNDVFFTETDETGERNVSFFECFYNKVYLYYVSETSIHIKSLLFKYYSGLTIDNYDNPKAKPSVIPFLVEYTKNYLYSRYDENQRIEAHFLDRLNETGSNTSAFEKWMNDYDTQRVREICLNTYHINDITDFLKSGQTETQTVSKTDNKEMKNEFSINFNEQSK